MGAPRPHAARPGALGAAAIVAVATVLPFAAQGRFGILGVGLLDDIGSHYALADSLRMGIELPLRERSTATRSPRTR